MAAARVKGAQGTDYSAPDKEVASPKHFAAYGQPEGGRDYNTTDMTDILKGEWGFDGFVEADWAAVAEMRACPPVNPDSGDCGHGFAADGPDAAAKALHAGLDSEMTSTLIRDVGAQPLAGHRISMPRLNDAVRRILRVKFRAGLLEHPIRRRFQGGVGADDSTTQRPAALLAQGSTRPSLQPTPQTRSCSRSASRAR